ncbi:HAD family hydrolase [Catellatospora sichuanensis]|uniref:HAD family hydrolase n=1 Tax=Catellatospora sichuanensis TaxID=1969805 RepID=UPI00118256FA|nr:HAD family phosphatase [Catellatospora sichuanensis]
MTETHGEHTPAPRMPSESAFEVDWDSYDSVLFDWDGTLVDSQPLNYVVLAEVLRQWCQVEITWQWYTAARGTRTPERLRQWEREHGRTLSVPVEDIFAETRTRLAARAGQVRVFEPVRAVAVQARARGLRCAVATGAERDVVLAGLHGTGLYELFDTVVSFDDVGIGKPDPAIFLAAAARLEAAPARCLVFEDSAIGVRAAQAAGMDVVDVRPSLSYAHPAGPGINLDGHRGLPADS